MKVGYASLSLGIAIVVGMLSLPASAQGRNDLAAFAGRWQINLEKSTMNHDGPKASKTLHARTFTFAFSPQGEGLRLDMYSEYPQAAPNRSVIFEFDEKPHPCKGDCIATGNAQISEKQQTYTFYEIDSHMVARRTHVDGKVSEYNTYAVSADGKTLSMIDWNPATPEWQNIFVFEKQP